MTTLFVSDLHLSAERPDKLELFDQFLEQARQRASALYILGDLFEVWIGDDDDSAVHQRVISSLYRLTAAGVTLHVAHGNRDFLFGARFKQITGAQLLPDCAVIDLHGTRTLLMHGDLLCTRDIKYQRFRRVVRNPMLRRAFLSAPLSWRKRIAQGTQSGTRASMARKSAEIMDVEQHAVAARLIEHNADLLIHGHTHRPDVHEFELAGRPRRRIVLGDWYEQDDVLICDSAGEQRMRVSEFLCGGSGA